MRGVPDREPDRVGPKPVVPKPGFAPGSNFRIRMWEYDS